MAVYGNTGGFKSCLPLLANDAATVAKYGRFLEAIGRRVVADAAPSEKRRLEQRLERAYLSVSGPDRCVAGLGTR